MKGVTLDKIGQRPYGFWILKDGTVIKVPYESHAEILTEMKIKGYDVAYDRGMVRVFCGETTMGLSFRGSIVSRETVQTMVELVKRFFPNNPNPKYAVEIYYQEREDTEAQPKYFGNILAAKNFLGTFYR